MAKVIQVDFAKRTIVSALPAQQGKASDATPPGNAVTLPPGTELRSVFDSVPPPPSTPYGDADYHEDRELDPVSDSYSEQEVVRLLGLPKRLLRRWSQEGIIVADEAHRYSFRDLISLRVAQGLLAQGVPARKVEQSISNLRKLLPNVSKPLAELRIQADGQKLVVRDDHGTFEPASGQRMLDLQVSALEEAVVSVLRPERADPSHRRRAYEAYLRGCRLEEETDKQQEAMQAYAEAVRLNPGLVHASINLTRLLTATGQHVEAEQLAERLVQAHPSQPEVHYNLGCFALDRGDTAAARARFMVALHLDPSYADAHFNLGLALEGLGDFASATTHYRRYLALAADTLRPIDHDATLQYARAWLAANTKV